MEISVLATKEDIEAAMLECSGSFFDQSKNNPSEIRALADKFYKNGIVLVAKNDQEIAGFIAFYCNDNATKQAYLSMIVIKSKYYGKGIGSNLLERMIHYCKENCFDRIKLEVNIANSRAIAFYLKHGFARQGYATENTEYYTIKLDKCQNITWKNNNEAKYVNYQR